MIPAPIKDQYQKWITELSSNGIPIKDKIIITYQKQIKESLEKLDNPEVPYSNESEYYTQLEQLLTENWALIQNTSLSYNSMPKSEATQVLCALAESLAQYRNQHLAEDARPLTALECLMPGLDLESAYPGFINLSPKEATQWTKEDESKLAALRTSYPDVDVNALDTLKETYEQEYNNCGTEEERLRVNKLISYQNQPSIEVNDLDTLKKTYEQEYNSCTEEERLRVNQLISYQNQLAMHDKNLNTLPEATPQDINKRIAELEASLSVPEKKLVAINEKIKLMKALELLPQRIKELETSLSDSEKNLVAINKKMKELNTYQLLARRYASYQEEQESGQYTRLNEHSAWLMPTASLERVLEETIVSVDQTTLIPIQVLLGEDPNLRPYGDYRETSQEDLDLERQRLHEHSPETRAFADAQTRLDQIKNDKSNLLGHLTTLCAHLRMNDAHGGKGVQDNAASGAYPAILAFKDYYEQLGASEKEKIPERVKKEIDLLLSVAFDASVNSNATENLQTCIGTRREHLEKEIKGQETQLAAIACSDEQKAILLKQAQEQMHLAEKTLKDALDNHAYKMDAPLPLSKKLLDALNLPLVIKNIEELKDLLRLSPEEFIALTQKEGGNQELSKLFNSNNIDALVMLFIEQGPKQINALFQATHPHLFNQLQPEDYPLIMADFLSDEKYTVVFEWLLKEKPDEAKALLYSAPLNRIALILKCLPNEERLAAVKEQDEDGDTLLHDHADNPELLNAILELLPTNQRQDAVKVCNMRGNSVLHLAATTPESLNIILKQYKETDRLKAVKEKNKNDDTVLHLAATTPESLNIVLSQYKDTERLKAVKEKNKNDDTVLHLAASTPESLNIVLSQYKDTERLKAVKEKNKNDDTVLHLAANSPASLNIVLNQYKDTERLKATQEKNKNGDTVLNLAANSPKSLQVLLPLYSSKKLLEAITEKNKAGHTILDLAISTPESLKILLEHLSKTHLRELKEKNQLIHKALSTATTTPESLKLLLGLYPQDQQQKLVTEKDKVTGKNLVHWAASASNSESLNLLLELCPQEQRLKLITEKSRSGESLLDIDDPQLLKGIMKRLPEEQLLEFFKQKDSHGTPILHKLAKNGELLKEALKLLPQHQLLEAIDIKNHANETILNKYVIRDAELLKDILKLYREEERLALVMNQSNLLNDAVSKPESLKVIIELLPPQQRLTALKYCVRSGFYENSSIILEVTKDPKLLKAIFELLTPQQRLELIKEKNSDDETLLHQAAGRPESLKILLKSLPPQLRLEAVKEKNWLGQTVITHAAESPKAMSFNIIMESLSAKERKNLLLVLSNEKPLGWFKIIQGLDNQLLIDTLSGLDNEQQKQCLTNISKYLSTDKKTELINMITLDMNNPISIKELLNSPSLHAAHSSQLEMDKDDTQLLAQLKEQARTAFHETPMNILLDVHKIQQFKKLRQELHNLHQEVHELHSALSSEHQQHHEALSNCSDELANINQVKNLDIKEEHHDSLHNMKTALHKMREEINVKASLSTESFETPIPTQEQYEETTYHGFGRN